MSYAVPGKVLITGGKPYGGVASFADALRCGFLELGLPVEIVSPSEVLRRIGELRDPGILKILSLSAVFAAPIARRALCIAHGVPCAAHQGWPTTLAILASLRVANTSRGARLIAVSGYTAVHLQAIFGLRVDAVIRNPVHPLFLEGKADNSGGREALTFVGRLHVSKNVDKIVLALRDVLDENPGLRGWIIGDGPVRPILERLVDGDGRIEFLGVLEPAQVRERLRRSRVFISANPLEPFGIVYLEALSQGCAVAMPASGGGLEIAPESIGGRIQLFGASLAHDEIAAALRRAVLATSTEFSLNAYSSREIAKAYLAADARFNSGGILHVEEAR